MHGDPSGEAGLEQTPVAGSQTPGSWHSPADAQTTELAPTHVPPWHESPCVHASPSLQAVPSASGAPVHAPVIASHVPAVMQGPLGAHTTGLPPVHEPAAQTSVWVHALPSLHAVLSALFETVHAPVTASQVPGAVHCVTAAQAPGFTGGFEQ